MSLDVIFHLVEDEVYEAYMRRLFDAAEEYVIIYSSNMKDDGTNAARHVRHRKFTRWISRNAPQWQCVRYIKNKYPLRHPDDDQLMRSFADFYFFRKTA